MKREKVGVVLIMFLCFLLLVPPLFSEGMILDAHSLEIDSCGNVFFIPGKYKDNAFFTILMSGMAFIGFVIPFAFEKIATFYKYISFLAASWFIAGLVYEVANIFTPEEVFNSFAQNWTYIKYLMIFTLGLCSIITFETWKTQKN